MRRLFIAILIVVVLLVAGVLGFVLLNVDKYRPVVQSELQKKLGCPVTLGHLGLRLFPLSIRVDGLTIGETAGFPAAQPFATAKEVYVSARLFSLLRGSPEVKDLSLENPQIEVIRNAAGVWNFSTIGGAKTSGNSSGELTLDELKINDGQVAVTDEAAKAPRSVYDHIDLKLSGFAPGKQFGLDVGVHFPGQGKELFTFNGKAGPLEAGNTAQLPLDGRFSLAEVTLSGVNRFSPGVVPANTDSVASGDGTVSSQGEIVGAKGNLKLENTVVHGAKLGYPIEAQFDVSDDRKQDKIQVRPSVVKLGATSFSISGMIDTATKPTNLNVRLTTNNSSIAELARLAGAFGVAFNPNYQVRGTLSADITAVGAMTAPQLNGSLSARQVQISGGEIKEPVSVPEIALTLSPQVVRSNEFSAQSGSTTLTGTVALSQYATKNMNVDATVKTNGADIGELLNMAKAYGVAAAQGVTGSGKLSLNARVQGPLSNTAQLVYSGTADIASATLATKSLTQPLVLNGAHVQFQQSSASLTASLLKAEDLALSNVRANGRFGAGTILLSPVSSDLFGGKESGTVSVDTRPAHPLCSAKIKFSGVDTNALLSAVSTMKDTLYGSMAADTNLTFTAGPGEALARSLNGSLNFNVTNGNLKNLNILNELSRVGKFLGSAPSQTAPGTALKRLSGTLDIVNGVATTNNLVAALDAGSLSANGSMNLVDEGLNLHVNAVLGSGVSQSVGGTHVGGFLNTALANNKGELVIPVMVTGTMQHPIVTPDMEAVAKMKLANLLPTSGNPSKLTSGLVGSVLGNKGGVGGVLGGILGQQTNQQAKPNQPAQPNTQQPQNPLGGLLKQFGQKKSTKSTKP